MKAMTLLVRLSWYVAARNADDAGLLGNQGPEAWDIMGLLGKAEITFKKQMDRHGSTDSNSKKPVFFDHFDPNCSIRVRPLANGLYDMPPQGFRRLLSRKFGSVAAPACLKRRRADLRGVRPNPGPTQ